MITIASDSLKWAGRVALFGVGLAVVLALVVLIALLAPTMVLASASLVPENKAGRSCAGHRFGGDGALRAKLPGGPASKKGAIG